MFLFPNQVQHKRTIEGGVRVHVEEMRFGCNAEELGFVQILVAFGILRVSQNRK